MKRKVAIYARVSTEHEAQINALGNQIQYYDNVLADHPNWELVERYIDEGITGTSVNKRKNFMRMIDDASRGLFDLIVTREVSRFARNTVDTLQETRKLKKLGVEVYFTEDNIWTFKDDDGELKLTIMATLAQNESKKTSQRVKAGQQISFENGVIYGTGNILGYDKVGKDFIINEDQAKIVRFIYKSFLEGNGCTTIKYQLEKKGYVTSTGLKKWNASYVNRVLQNPFYCGTIVYRKSYIPDYLEQKPKRNRGEVKQVIVEGSHEPIISKEDFQKAQELIKSRTVEKNDRKIGGGIPRNLWGLKLKCECGSSVHKKKYHMRSDGTISYCFQCYKQIREGSVNTRIKKGLSIDGACNSPLVPEWKLQLAANLIFSSIFKDKDCVVEQLIDLIDKYIKEETNIDIYQSKLSEINKQIDDETQSIDRLLNLYLKGIIDESKYTKKKEESDIILNKLMSEKNELLDKTGTPKGELEKRVSKIKKSIVDYANYLDNNISDNIIDQFTSKIVIKTDCIEWYLSCLEELKGLLNKEDSPTLFAEVEMTNDNVELFKKDNPEYKKISLKNNEIIKVFI